MSQATGSYVGSLLLFSLTLFLVAMIGTMDVILRKIQKVFSKEDNERVDNDRKPPNNINCEEEKEPKISDFEQDVLSTWL